MFEARDFYEFSLEKCTTPNCLCEIWVITCGSDGNLSGDALGDIRGKTNLSSKCFHKFMTFIIIKERVNFGMFQHYLRLWETLFVAFMKWTRKIVSLHFVWLNIVICCFASVLLEHRPEQILKIINQIILFVIAICKFWVNKKKSFWSYIVFKLFQKIFSSIPDDVQSFFLVSSVNC